MKTFPNSTFYLPVPAGAWHTIGLTKYFREQCPWNMMCSSQEFTGPQAATSLSIWQTPTQLRRSFTFISSARPAPNNCSLPRGLLLFTHLTILPEHLYTYCLPFHTYIHTYIYIYSYIFIYIYFLSRSFLLDYEILKNRN